MSDIRGMTLPVALVLLGVALVMWRTGLRLPGAVLGACVAYVLAGERAPESLHAVLVDLAGGLSGSLLVLLIVAVGFAVCVGWRPGAGSRRR